MLEKNHWVLPFGERLRLWRRVFCQVEHSSVGGLCILLPLPVFHLHQQADLESKKAAACATGLPLACVILLAPPSLYSLQQQRTNPELLSNYTAVHTLSYYACSLTADACFITQQPHAFFMAYTEQDKWVWCRTAPCCSNFLYLADEKRAPEKEEKEKEKERRRSFAPSFHWSCIFNLTFLSILHTKIYH